MCVASILLAAATCKCFSMQSRVMKKAECSDGPALCASSDCFSSVIDSAVPAVLGVGGGGNTGD